MAKRRKRNDTVTITAEKWLAAVNCIYALNDLLGALENSWIGVQHRAACKAMLEWTKLRDDEVK